MQETRARSWNHLQELLFTETWDPVLGRFRSRLAYRGLSDVRYRLETTLMRLGGPYADLERHLLRNFKKYAHRKVVDQDSLWNWLAVAQHYGLPTRLLDWTYSPLIALHFATANIDKFDRDGVIWAVNYLKVHQRLPRELLAKLDREGANVFTVEMLAETVGSLTEYEALAGDDSVIFFEPPSIDERIINQFALFSMMPSAAMRFDQWLQRHPELCWKIVIPAELKWEIRDKLDQANMTERVLFPGLDGLSRWLARHYSPKRERAGGLKAMVGLDV
ncbi:MAG: FRG domain-containing protein [Desulfuromonadales bacterium]|nr:FRG domain-containing protein [Desulfuromonadales bacterium]